MMPSRTFTFLGTGTSVGVPMVGCRCDVCRSTDPRNKRFRCSVLIGTPAGNILIDTSPELRLQLVREQVAHVDAVLYTHAHADHLHGLDDLRPFGARSGKPVPLHCSPAVEERIRRAFDYAFPPADLVVLTYLPRLVFRPIVDAGPFDVLDQRVVPIPLLHSTMPVLGFRIGDVAYCTDVSAIPEPSMDLLADLDVLVIDALRYKSHPAHFSIDEAVQVSSRLKPRRTYLTHLNHDVDHATASRMLPEWVALAYDGLKFEF